MTRIASPLAVAAVLATGCQSRPLSEHPLFGDAGHAETASRAETAADPSAFDDDLLKRWNAAVDAVEAAGTDPCTGLPAWCDSHWRTVADFPHPTYKGGTQQAYTRTASVLLMLYRTGDNLQFLLDNQLLDRSYKSGPALERQLTVTLRSLTCTLPTSPLVSANRQAGLQAISKVIGC